ncbi:hypothetical protein HII36_14165 [Nonomuraea sp. NN258]|uniref:hypothetical protein n=1 Tax=Nonomuraea antri TaxID=2730852 RepID=UPI0015697E8B|nr:hypothetical protein [Nonomuraea antri]NRQ32976.1 hypothetical protein [Nonomuraea antri]
MQALDADHRHAFANPAGTPVLAGRSVLLALRVSTDKGRTWRASGALNLPTDRYEAAARLFLMTAMSTTPEDLGADVVWQVQAWLVDEGEDVAAGAPPLVSLRSDGRLPSADVSQPLPPP